MKILLLHQSFPLGARSLLPSLALCSDGQPARLPPTPRPRGPGPSSGAAVLTTAAQGTLSSPGRFDELTIFTCRGPRDCGVVHCIIGCHLLGH